ncbi:MAG TPA: peptidase T [Candidatus Enterocloster faecavium]|uniref:Peptidase T n=1 Tax=Candidatus Enterocloster faecavium TaxID=2838560 RepID=A0A9D2L7S2_9FIRM|nr:peptidase T [Candidatus Enterocloster faecavium]
MSQIVSRFLSYVSLDTQSCPDQSQVPSTQKQLVLARTLAKELKEMGAQEVTVSEHGYVYAAIPASEGREHAPVLGFVAHMDTSPALSGTNVKPRVILGYDGGDICLNENLGIWLKTADFPELTAYKGQDLITADGTTLLGADDKAGVAEIMTMAEYFLSHPEEPHGPIRIAFTPDEEVGRGTDFFDVGTFGAQVAYTVDGGMLGELEYENFNAASGKVKIHGASIHPGSAKGRMKNALLIAMEFQSLLPAFQNPMYTEGYEGFYHLDQMDGTVEEARMEYIIRDHDRQKFEEKKKFFASAASFLNEKYGPETVTIQVEDTYYNMKEVIQDHMELIDRAKEAMEELDITPIVTPIRGGTDGARLSFMGIPCPNLCTGGHNFHGKYEFVCVQSMERIAELLIRIAGKFGDEDRG